MTTRTTKRGLRPPPCRCGRILRSVDGEGYFLESDLWGLYATVYGWCVYAAV